MMAVPTSRVRTDDEDCILHVPEVADLLNRIGLGTKDSPVTVRQVRRWAAEKRLPFFLSFQRKLVITRSALLLSITKLQEQAKVDVQRKASAAERRDATIPRRRS